MEPCAKVVSALFGSFFLIALLSVPVTTTTAKLRQDPDSNIVIRTTYPQNSRMFLSRYLSMKAHSPEGSTVRVRSRAWVATMAIIVVLGVFDGLVFCRLLRRPRRQEGGPGPDVPGASSGQDSTPTGFSLFP
jgi:hypothetical protein